MSHNVAYCLAVPPIWVDGNYRAFLCSSSKMKKQEVTLEVNNVQNAADTKDWNPVFGTPIIPVGMAL